MIDWGVSAGGLLGALSCVLIAGALARAVILFARIVPLALPHGGIRGERRRRALQSAVFRCLDPLLRRSGSGLRGLLRELSRSRPGLKGLIVRWESETRRLLVRAGETAGLDRYEVMVLNLVFALVGAFIGYQFGRDSSTLLWVVPGALFGAVLPHARLQSARNERFSEMGRELPSAIDLIALAMNAGCDFPGAIRRVIDGQEGVVAQELGEVLRSLELGITRGAALLALRERIPILEVRDLVRAVLLAERKGASVTEALQQQARASRQRRSVRAEEAAARAGVLMLLPLMLLMCCVLILLMGPLAVAGMNG